ncbi:MAG: VOC family protein [Chitinophagaceae bacterium]|nr:MAG: VOC family protein [Chitinophagaceae bacterium]
MENSIGQLALVVKDYDEAIAFYVNQLGFTLIEDTRLSDIKRWVVVSPPGNRGANLLLAKAGNHEQEKFIGNQTGGRVFLFLYTDDFDGYYTLIKNNGVKIVREMSEEVYGKVAVFADLYGTLWDLIERVSPGSQK